MRSSAVPGTPDPFEHFDGVREGQDPLESGSLLCANNAIFDGFAKVIRDV